MRRTKSGEEGWGDGSVGEMLMSKAWGMSHVMSVTSQAWWYTLTAPGLGRGEDRRILGAC